MNSSVCWKVKACVSFVLTFQKPFPQHFWVFFSKLFLFSPPFTWRGRHSPGHVPPMVSNDAEITSASLSLILIVKLLKGGIFCEYILVSLAFPMVIVVCVLSCLLCLILCDLMEYSLPSSSFHGILQARIVDCPLLLQGIFPTEGLIYIHAYISM